MKLKHTFIIGTFLFASVAVTAQEKKAASKPVPSKSSADKPVANKAEAPSPEEVQKAWTVYMTPGEMHKRLMSEEGQWHESITTWMGPDQEPTQMEAEFTCKSIYDGRFQESNHTGTMMGMPFEGRSVIGYNNVTKMYESTWIDNMSTGITYLKGAYNEKTRSINYIGKTVDPVSGKEIPARQVYTFVDDNSRMLEMYETKGGKEMKTMTIKMTRN